MSSIEFIKSQLSDIIGQFPEIRARYENDEINNTHIIEITPSETYNNSTDFKIIEESIIFKFIELYPFENVVFLAGDDEYKLKKVDFEYIGYDHFKKPSFFYSPKWLLSVHHNNTDNNAIDNLFINYDAEIETHFKMKINLNSKKTISKLIRSKIYKRVVSAIDTGKLNILPDNKDNTKYDDGDVENNYALSA
ncbi:MAG: hypothetical protein AAGC65_13395 [Mucilaginibacter sp.]|uniref:hypothetical protein n=1 Tax=Mucilaginibacter sp. TaxID=1882438 RepID=UPI0031AB5803